MARPDVCFQPAEDRIRKLRLSSLWVVGLLEDAQYGILKFLSRRPPEPSDGGTCSSGSRLLVRLGEDLADKVRGKCVVDYGCGGGQDAIELVKLGAREVFGVEIREAMLSRARMRANGAGVAARCRFGREADVQADLIVCIDCFEHFAEPDADLRRMHDLLVPGGIVEISFGPPWYHPLGGHLFSVIPWAHVLFSEEALIRWRSDVRNDGAQRFSEAGLNQMTIKRFERLLADSLFRVEQVRCVPIRQFMPIHCRLNRELTTSVVRCTLRRGGGSRSLSAS